MDEVLVKLEWETATDLLKKAKEILLVTHVRPDGDAFGSMCGLGLALQERDYKITMLVDGGGSQYLSFVPGADQVTAAFSNDLTPDLVIFCDISDPERGGEVGRRARHLGCPLIIIDHHVTNALFGTAHIVNSEYVSTTEAVLRWLDHLKWDISQPVATALMVGFVTDTISFRVGPVTAETLGQVQRLMVAGADLRHVTERMVGRTEFNQLKMMGKGLGRMKYEESVAWTHLRVEDFRELGLSTADKPELSGEILRPPEVYISCFFLETEEGDVRLSMRAKPGFDVGTLALELGGGGHTQAAGVVLRDIDLDTVIEKVVPMLKEEAQNGALLYA